MTYTNMEINDRVKIIREEKGLSQTEFGKQLSLERSTISLIERKQRTLTDRTIKDICREFNINENWLRTGTGNMKVPENDAVKIAALLLRKKDPVFESLVDTFSKLNPENRKILLKLSEALLDDDAEKKE